jgi:putative ABC transport system permease protein
MSPGEAVPASGSPWALLLLGTLRAPARFAALVGTMAVVAFLAFGTLWLREGVEDAVTAGMGRLGADLMIVPAGQSLQVQRGLIGGVPVTLALPEGVQAFTDRMAGVKAAPQFFLQSATADCCESGNLLLVAFDPDRDFTVMPWVLERMPPPPGRDPVWVGAAVRKVPGAGLLLYGHDFFVAGRMARTGLGYFDNAVFMTRGGAERMERSSRDPGRTRLEVDWSRPSLVLLQLDAAGDAGDLARELRARWTETEVVTAGVLVGESRERLAAVLRFLFPATLAVWLAAAAIGFLGQVLYWSPRRHVLGLLQALGAAPRRILAGFVLEALAGALAGAGAGVGMTWIVFALFSTHFQVMFGLPMRVAVEVIPLSSALLAGAAFLGTSALPVLLVLGCHLKVEPYALVRGGR